jgi:hypothetical protein
MAHQKKKLQAYDNPCFSPMRCNTVARCNSVSIIESNCIAEGTPSHCFSNGTDEEDILVPDKIGIAYHSCSEAPIPNNRSIPMNIISKPCHTNDQHKILNLPSRPDQPSTLIKVGQIYYKIDFIKEKCLKRRKCIMHSINSWKDSAHLQALAVIMAGKKPYYYFK